MTKNKNRSWRTNVQSLGLLFGAMLLWGASEALLAQTPEWIWSHPLGERPQEERLYFRKTFRTPALLWNAKLSLAADDRAEVFLNGVSVGSCEQADQPIRLEVSTRLNQGENVIAVVAKNSNGPAGLLVQLNLGGETNLVSDSSWLVSEKEEQDWANLAFSAAHWKRATTVGAYGIEPWGPVFSRPAATPAESIKVPTGFRVELLRSGTTNEGSWICMTFDHRGRIIISPQGDSRPLLRLSLAGGKISQVEQFAPSIRDAMGFLFAFDSFYANARGPQGAGLYRLIDSNHNDQFETNEVHLLKKFEGGSEHGYHALALGPDKKIYILNGNGVKLPAGISTNSPYRNYGEDMLFTGGKDQDQDGAKAPAAHVFRTDEEGKEWELFMGGMRNAYDFDFNPDGELFTFDSDMEWDWGTPWYRATRVIHCVSGGEYGWRDGLRMWSDQYPDMLAPVAYIGIGSPTGVKFGTRSKFPEKYQRGLFLMDWSYGRILMANLQPHDSTYSATIEPFLQAKQLNLTSMSFGPDGSLYFITGGRGTQSGLYRVIYTAAESKPMDLANTSGKLARELRHKLEAFHTKRDPDAVDFIWPRLSSRDPSIRFAARVALENQDVVFWRERAISERETMKSIQSLLALARVGSASDQGPILKSLARLPLAQLPPEIQLMKLRAIELALIRQTPAEGIPSETELTEILQELGPLYPRNSSDPLGWPLNKELSRLLFYFGPSLDVIHTTVQALKETWPPTTQEQQLHYVSLLRGVRKGWKPTDRRDFFSWWLQPRNPKAHPPELLQWFADVGRGYVDGAWFDRYLRDFRRDAISTLTPREKADLGSLIEAPFTQAQSIPASATPRKFVKDWEMTDFSNALEQVGQKRDLARGKRAFVDAQCLSCHRFGNDGGIVGPELTAAASKYSPRDLLESILDPSKVINEQYQNHTVLLKDGDIITGRLASQSDQQVVIETDRIYGTQEKIPRSKIESLKPSAVSPMPSGLVNTLTKEEILDLLAYLASGGNIAQGN